MIQPNSFKKKRNFSHKRFYYLRFYECGKGDGIKTCTCSYLPPWLGLFPQGRPTSPIVHFPLHAAGLVAKSSNESYFQSVICCVKFLIKIEKKRNKRFFSQIGLKIFWYWHLQPGLTWTKLTLTPITQHFLLIYTPEKVFNITIAIIAVSPGWYHLTMLWWLIWVALCIDVDSYKSCFRDMEKF